MQVEVTLLLVKEFDMRPYSLSLSSMLCKCIYVDVIAFDCILYSLTLSSLFGLHDKSGKHRMEAVFAWCKGVKFVEVQKLTGSFEGTTIRTLRRLEELVRQIASAAKAIGDRELEEKFEEGSKLLKRDIVFCSSLYL
jgi:superfamily II RNA helicase